MRASVEVRSVQHLNDAAASSRDALPIGAYPSLDDHRPAVPARQHVVDAGGSRAERPVRTVLADVRVIGALGAVEDSVGCVSHRRTSTPTVTQMTCGNCDKTVTFLRRNGEGGHRDSVGEVTAKIRRGATIPCATIVEDAPRWRPVLGHPGAFQAPMS